MSLLDQIGAKSLQDLHQYVMAWIDQAGRVVQDLLRENEIQFSVRFIKRDSQGK